MMWRTMSHEPSPEACPRETTVHRINSWAISQIRYRKMLCKQMPSGSRTRYVRVDARKFAGLYAVVRSSNVADTIAVRSTLILSTILPKTVGVTRNVPLHTTRLLQFEKRCCLAPQRRLHGAQHNFPMRRHHVQCCGGSYENHSHCLVQLQKREVFAEFGVTGLL